MLKALRYLAAAVPLMAASFAFGDIAGSKHDFSAQAWSDNQICKPCHTPHNADVSITGRIWAHTMSTATYKYHGGSVTNDKSTSGDAATGSLAQSDLDGASRLCLSCHDGTVALDSFKGKDGGSTGKSISDLAANGGLYDPNIGGGSVGGNSADLSNDHPVGYKAMYKESSGSSGHFYYKPLSNLTGLKLANSPTAVPAGTKDQSGADVAYTVWPSVSCVSCHDVHNGSAPSERGLLRKSNAGSALCLTCHNK